MDRFLSELAAGGGTLGGGGGGMLPGMEKLLEGIPGMEGMSKEEMMGHVDKLWKHMDDLSEDPEAYKAFLDKQAEAAGVPAPGSTAAPPARDASIIVNARFTKAPATRPPLAPSGAGVVLATQPPPMVHAVVALWAASGAAPGPGPPTAGPGEAPLSEAGPPAGDWAAVAVPLRMRAPPFEQRTTEGNGAIIYEVLCHPDTLALAREGALAAQFRPVLVELAFRWLEQEHGIALSRSGRQMRLLTAPSADAPGSPSAALSAAASSAASGTGAAGMSQGLLDQLAGMGMGTGAGTAAGAGTPGGSAASGAPPAPKRPLVQEVEPPVVAGQPDGAKPRLQYEVKQEPGEGAQVQVCVQAPEGVKAADFDLDIAGADLIVGATAASERTVIALPFAADGADVRAKFDKRARKLAVTIRLA
eukprot:jgi/Tetstr1/453592/TSEL_003986.t1